jgi:hypothetical protein
MLILATAKLLHVLVFVYWLGGDVGAFYASFVVTDARRTAGERAVALKLLSAIDLAPAVAIVLAFPSGLWLAAVSGWLPVSASSVVAAGIVGVIWLYFAVSVQLGVARHRALLQRVDGAIRVAVVIGLIVVAVQGLVRGRAGVPLFIAIKCVILATCIILGLAIRRELGPFAVAFDELLRTAGTPSVNEALRSSMTRARCLVLAIWLCLVAAAAIGISRAPL